MKGKAFASWLDVFNAYLINVDPTLERYMIDQVSGEEQCWLWVKLPSQSEYTSLYINADQCALSSSKAKFQS